MKKTLMTVAVLLGAVSLAQAQPTHQHGEQQDAISQYDNVKIKEEATSTRQVITPTADGTNQVTTTTQGTQKRVGINENPNVRIDGKPALNIKEEVSTSEPVSTTTVTPAGADQPIAVE